MPPTFTCTRLLVGQPEELFPAAIAMDALRADITLALPTHNVAHRADRPVHTARTGRTV